MANTFENQVSILAELWMNYRSDQDMKDFIEYNDLGLPLAYFIHNELVEPKSQAKMFVTETYDLFIAAVGAEDLDFTSLDEVLGNAASKE